MTTKWLPSKCVVAVAAAAAVVVVLKVSESTSG